MTSLWSEYAERRSSTLEPLALRVADYLAEHLNDFDRIDRISARAKATDRFVAKAEKTLDDGTPKYDDPLSEIQDQVGARIVAFYTSDVEKIVSYLPNILRIIENAEKEPERAQEFGYFGHHLVAHLPSNVFHGAVHRTNSPRFFELQIKTLFQHAWGEAEHDLGYKAQADLTDDQRRLIALASAQAWGADRIFDDLYKELDEPSDARPAIYPLRAPTSPEEE